MVEVNASRESTPAVGGVRRAFAPWADPAAKPLIRFEGVTKRYGDVTAVDDLTLDIHEREFFALLGPSGCGKSTLMRLLAGFETPTRGRVTLAGEDLAPVPAHRRPVNMMFQSYALFPHMSVERNIAFGLEMQRLPRAEIAERVLEMLRLVQLEPFARRRPDQLSGGQRQRVALARALACRPKVLLLDEPLGALDRKLREETRFELMNLQERLGLTFLIVTHDQEEAMALADRIAVMDRGRIVQVATPAEIYETPASRWVADFVGDVVILEAKVAARDGHGIALATPSGTRLDVSAGPDAAPGTSVWVAVRPEKIRIAHESPPAGTPNVLAGVVADIGYLGDTSIYRVRLDDGTEVKAALANTTRLVARPIGWDDRVHLSFAPEAGVLLVR